MDRLDRYSPAAAEHVRRPRNPGRVEDPDAEGEAANPPCGDLLRISLRVEDGRVSEARFLAEGCAATLAAGSALTEILQGRTPDEILSLTPQELDETLGGLPEGRFHAVEMACRAARDAIRKGGLG